MSTIVIDDQTRAALESNAKARGMDLVTVTDHDSIEAVESLSGQPGFFLSEEVFIYHPETFVNSV